MSQTACNHKPTSYIRFKDTDVLKIYKKLLTDIETARTAYVSTDETDIISDYDNETTTINAKNTANDALCVEIDTHINALEQVDAAQAWLDVALRGKTGEVVKNIGAIWPDGESKEDSFKKSFLSLTAYGIRDTLGIVASRTKYEFSNPNQGYGYTPLGDVTTRNPEKKAKKYIQILRKQIKAVSELRSGQKKLDALRAELALGYSIIGFRVDAKDILDYCTWKTRTWYRAYADVCKDDVFVSTAYQNVFNVLCGTGTDKLSVKPLSTDYTPEQIAWINLYKERGIGTFRLPGYFEQDFIEIYEKHPLPETGVIKKTLETGLSANMKFEIRQIKHT